MRLSLSVVFTLLLIAIGCGDNTTPTPGDLVVDPASSVLQIGDDVTLTAKRGDVIATDATWASSNPGIASVTTGNDGTAVVHAVANGAATITATSGTTTAAAAVNVTGATLSSIAITPPTPSLAAGTTVQLVATGTFSDGTIADISSMATWSSSATAVATVDATGEVSGITAGVSTITAALDGVSGTVDLTVTSATLVAIAVTPMTPTLARGTPQQLVATGTFSDTTTQNLTSQVAWSSATTAAATVTSGGLVTAVDPGTSVITATLGAISGSTTVTVTAATLTSIDVTPATPSIADGQTQQFAATGHFSDTTTQNLTATVTWASTMTGVATIAGTGLATAIDPGTTTISATMGAISGSTTLTVTSATLVSIAVTPVDPSIARGLTQQFTATGTFSDATTQNLTSTVTWTSGTPATATISNAAGSQGLATGAAAGTSTITATSGTITGATTLAVTPAVLVSIQVEPITPSVSVGFTRQFTAIGTFSDTTTSDLTTSVTWASSATATAQISNAAGSQGLGTGIAAGTTTISATSGTIVGSTTLTVTDATLVSIAITPVDPSLPDGLDLQFTAIGTYSDASTSDLTTSVSWASSDGTIAGISNAVGSQGRATALAVGTTTISATSGTISASTTLTVTPAVLVSIAVTPADANVPNGLAQQYAAIGTFSDASTQTMTTQVTWASTMTAAAQISNASGSEGLAQTVAAGSTTISATFGTISGSTTLTVTAAALVSIAVTPVNPTINQTATVQYTAIGTFTDSTTQDLTATATWASLDITVAQVSSTGLATGIGAGTTTITAGQGAIIGSAGINVLDPAPTVVSTSPLDAATNVTAQTTIVATFDLAMNPATITTQTASGPCSASLQVSRDDFASCIGFAAAAPVMSGGNKIATATPAPALAFGTAYKIRVTTAVTSATGAAMAASFTQPTGFTTAVDLPCGTGLVISEVYGGGGNTGSLFNNDFIELHNPTAASISLAGHAIQFISATGTGTWAVQALPSVSISAGGYYLIQEAAGTAMPAPLPTPDFIPASSFTIGAGSFKVALTNTATALAGACPASAALVDLVGAGATASCFEGTAPTGAPANATSVQRRNNGCSDSNNNVADFAVLAPTPTNGAAANDLVCACSVNETNLSTEADYCNLQFPPSTTVGTGMQSAQLFAQIFETGVTPPAGADPSVIAQIGFGPTTSNPQNQPGWTWVSAVFNVQVGNNDEYKTQFTGPAAGSYAMTSRFSFDGIRWTYCDLDGAGANAGLSFDPAKLGTLTVTP